MASTTAAATLSKAAQPGGEVDLRRQRPESPRGERLDARSAGA
jgi:hypothetical protein